MVCPWYIEVRPILQGYVIVKLLFLLSIPCYHSKVYNILIVNEKDRIATIGVDTPFSIEINIRGLTMITRNT